MTRVLLLVSGDPFGELSMLSALKLLAYNRSGVTSIEYALIAGSIFLVIVTAVGAVGAKLNDVFSSVASGF